MDAAASVAAPEAGNSGSLYGSGSGVDVDSGNDDCSDNSEGNGDGYVL